MADPEDVLADSLETLYDYVPVALSSSGSTFSYQSPYTNDAIELVTPDTQAANWSLHATSIWRSSIYIADHLRDLGLDHHVNRAGVEDRPLTLLELGSGAGLPSIIIAKMYRDVLVTASDYPDESLISTLSENVKRNEVSDRCRVVPYAWGSDPSPLLSQTCGGFDIVLAADTLWNLDLHDIFIDTLRFTLKRSPDARVYIVAGLHTGRYVIESFLGRVQGAGFIAETLTERRVDGSEERPWTVERAEDEDDRERRRWVVWMAFKWAAPC
ncbi:hypothetical protein BN946_scf184746.g37 [Trametes cinnabarina]|uniref:Protein N-terminal and lysine N-methyltransferase EFM7 n=1 Tax=Pycnoporus cinnabarinus TaxID=5643 RepID=A0A060S5C0_PYCCI|nr:hypothetical protein BN946_scf184746.g37 [Trametes cinnabarina]